MFQKGLVCILFFIYSLSLVKPVLPVISDTIAHIFWYSQHIATVHSEKGKYHLHIAVMKATDQKNQDQSIPFGKSEIKVNEHMANSFLISLTLISRRLLHHPHFISFFPKVLLANSPHPPE